MKIVIFGLTITSSWGNGHATLWRALCRALIRRGHEICFLERDVPYYAQHRDLTEIQGGTIVLYNDWNSNVALARRELNDADVAMVTSFCPDANAATELLFEHGRGTNVFYDLDTPVTLADLDAGKAVPYIPERGFGDFDLVLSYTGGVALNELQRQLGARRVAPLYGSVDPDAHFPVCEKNQYQCDLSYLGTYAADRQPGLLQNFIEPARQLAERKFLIGGAMYPQDFPWANNISFLSHVPPPEHPAFFCSSRITLNITRKAMAEMGYCPSGRLFEAAACGTPLLSDWWEGLDDFYKPGSEILISNSTEDAVAMLELSDLELERISRAARERTLAEHTATARAIELENILGCESVRKSA